MIIDEHSREIVRCCEIIVSFAPASRLGTRLVSNFAFSRRYSLHRLNAPHLRKNTRKRVLEFRFDSFAAASSSPHLTLSCSTHQLLAH